MSWIWPGWIPRGCVSLVLGEPGVGKSLYVLQLAAMVTRGWSTMPTSSGRNDVGLDVVELGFLGGAEAEKAGGRHMECGCDRGGTVVLFDAGDAPSLLRARLDAAGADVERIVLVERAWRGDSSEEVEEFLQPQSPRPSVKPLTRVDKDRELQRDLESLEQHVLQLKQAGHDVSLVIIDPIESLLRESIDPHRFARLLSQLADRLNVAIVAVGTTCSKSRAYPGLRVDGKGIDALFKVSKTVVTVARDAEQEQQRVVLPTKLNLSATPPGLTFGFADNEAIEWQQVATPPAEDVVLTEPCDEGKNLPEPQRSPEQSRAMTWLKQRLSDGEVAVAIVKSGAQKQKISKATLRQAFEELGCINKKAARGGHWVWLLPEVIENVETAAPETESPDLVHAVGEASTVSAR